MLMRILAAVVLLPLLLVLLLVLPQIYTVIVCGVVGVIAAYELLWRTGLVKNVRMVCYAGLTAFGMAFWCYWGMEYRWALLGVLLLFCALMAEVLVSRGKLPFAQAAYTLAGGLLIPFLLTSLLRLFLMEQGRILILIPLVIAFVSDSCAYFVGCAIGKHKLAPAISPKKSVEGAVGGVLGAVLGMELFCLVLQLAFRMEPDYVTALVFGLLGAVAGIFGDLCFSVIKRQTSIKDYGNLIPGHGGILDRIDSLLIVGPMVEVLMLLLPVL